MNRLYGLGTESERKLYFLTKSDKMLFLSYFIHDLRNEMCYSVRMKRGIVTYGFFKIGPAGIKQNR